MDVDDFVTWWRERERADIERMIDALDAVVGTADGEIGRLRAGAEVGALLRRSGRARLGCRAAHDCSQAAVEACARTGVLRDDRSAATRLARAAGDAARGLVLGLDHPGADELIRPFRPVLAFRSAA